MNALAKSCPFCGKAAEVTIGPSGEEAQCPDEDCAGNNWTPLERWNRRAPDPSPGLVRELRDAAQAGYGLSCYAAAINWTPGDNTREWLDELKRQIEHMQSLGAAITHADAYLREHGAESEAGGEGT